MPRRNRSKSNPSYDIPDAWIPTKYPSNIPGVPPHLQASAMQPKVAEIPEAWKPRGPPPNMYRGAPRGMPPRGMLPRGMPPRGMPPRGMPPQGVQNTDLDVPDAWKPNGVPQFIQNLQRPFVLGMNPLDNQVPPVNPAPKVTQPPIQPPMPPRTYVPPSPVPPVTVKTNYTETMSLLQNLKQNIAPVLEEEASPVLEEEASPVLEEEASPVLEEEASPVQEEASPVQEEEASLHSDEELVEVEVEVDENGNEIEDTQGV